MTDRRQKDKTWFVTDEQGALYQGIKDGAMLATLMDIRDELQRLNRTLECDNFLAIPHHLRAMRDDIRQLNKRVKRKVPLR